MRVAASSAELAGGAGEGLRKRISTAAGPADGAYYRFARDYAERLAGDGIELDVVTTMEIGGESGAAAARRRVAGVRAGRNGV
jgi:hypothetical protein